MRSFAATISFAGDKTKPRDGQLAPGPAGSIVGDRQAYRAQSALAPPDPAAQRMNPSSSFFAQAITSLLDCPESTLAIIDGWMARAYICAAMSGGAG